METEDNWVSLVHALGPIGSLSASSGLLYTSPLPRPGPCGPGTSMPLIASLLSFLGERRANTGLKVQVRDLMWLLKAVNVQVLLSVSMLL